MAPNELEHAEDVSCSKIHCVVTLFYDSIAAGTSSAYATNFPVGDFSARSLYEALNKMRVRLAQQLGWCDKFSMSDRIVLPRNSDGTTNTSYRRSQIPGTSNVPRWTQQRTKRWVGTNFNLAVWQWTRILQNLAWCIRNSFSNQWSSLCLP